MTDEAIDLAAASRISKRVDLRSIRLAEIVAKCQPDVAGHRPLQPIYTFECKPAKVGTDAIEVSCSYKFKVRSADIELAEAEMTYYLVYKLSGDEPTAEADVQQFARANGAYHTWPFVREAIFSLTAKMGFPPFTLPVLMLLPKPKPAAPPEGDTQSSTAATQ